MKRLPARLPARLLARLVATVVVVAAAAVLIPTTPAAAAADPDPADHPLGDLAQTPPMGWNSWNTFHCDVSAKLIEETADAMVESGMRAAGYEYVNIDDCWMTKQRDAEGRLVPDPVKFPEGIRGVADYVHDKGLKLGIYSSAGSVTCQQYPASLHHEEIDAQTFADWGVDLLKYDNCGDHDGLSEQVRYQRMHDALEKTGRDIMFSLCDWGNGEDWLWNGKEQVGHYFRNTGDISASWGSVLGLLDEQTEMYKYSGPNNWADPDMLEVGVAPLTYNESRAHMALWSVLNAPLISGNDVRSMTPRITKLLTNETLIGINQDWSGQQGRRLKLQGDKDIWYKKMSDGSVAVVLLNRGERAQTISARGTAFGLKDSPLVVENVWNGTSYSSYSNVRARVAPHDAAVFVVRNAKNKSLESLTTLETVAPAYTPAADGFTATVRLHNDGTQALSKARLMLDVPPGYEAAGPTSAQVAKVKPGDAAELKVRLRADGPDIGDLQIRSRANWLHKGDLRNAEDDAMTAVVAAPPAGESHVSDLEFLASTNYWGPVERDQSNGEVDADDGKVLTIGGTTFDKGLGAHAPSQVDVYTGGSCSGLTAKVGLDDEVGDRGAVEFVVLADGEEVARVAADGKQNAQDLTADVAGADVVSLVIDEGADTLYDHADWAQPTLSC